MIHKKVLPPEPLEVTITLNDNERIVEGRTVDVRDRNAMHTLHVLIVEIQAKSRGSKKVWRRALVECPSGMQIPGKGENGFDCGEDAIYAASFVAETVKEAVRKFMDDVRRTRKERS